MYLAFSNSCFYFGAAVAKVAIKYTERYPPKKSFWKPWSLFSQFESSENKEVLPNLIWPRDVTGRINFIQSLFL